MRGDLEGWRRALATPGAARAAGNAVQPDAGNRRYARGAPTWPMRPAPSWWWTTCSPPAAAAAAGARARTWWCIRHQAHRRPGPGAGRRGAWPAEMDRGDAAALYPQHRPCAVAVQCLDAAEGHGDAVAAGGGVCARAAAWPTSLPARPTVSRVWYPGRADHPQHALAMRQMTAAERWSRLNSPAASGGVPLLQRAAPDRDQQQSRRQPQHGDPSGHHHAYAHRRRGTCAARHHRWRGAAVGRARGSGRPERRPGGGLAQPRCGTRPSEARDERDIGRAEYRARRRATSMFASPSVLLGGPVRARRGPLCLGLPGDDREPRGADGAAARPNLAHHRRARPHVSGAGRRRGGRTAGARTWRGLRIYVGNAARDAVGVHDGQYHMVAHGHGPAVSQAVFPARRSMSPSPTFSLDSPHQPGRVH